MTLLTTSMASPLGRLRLFATGDALIGIYLPDHKAAPALVAREQPDHPVLRAARDQLDAYFAGTRTRFALPLAPAGTPFQHAVWQALGEIPFGATWTYAALARRLGRPNASRAVGAANARNPISIIVPCHRVVGSGGALTGYAGGVAAKQWLLDHEVRHEAGRGARAAAPVA
jgi:methylated-DNA-[protein]-cysteine S-methyltransferase